MDGSSAAKAELGLVAANVSLAIQSGYSVERLAKSINTGGLEPAAESRQGTAAASTRLTALRRVVFADISAGTRSAQRARRHRAESF